MRIAACCMAGAILLATSLASARTPLLAARSDGVVRPSTTGMVKPESVVDPGMKVIRPKAPTASTPVIKPAPTTPDGSVVVPR